jgi:enoyl-CoA hydratase/carnithine racemase
MDMESALELETEIQAACMEDPNFREAYEAFVAKRRPEFR